MKAFFKKLIWEKSGVIQKTDCTYDASKKEKNSKQSLNSSISSRLNLIVITERGEYITFNIIDLVKFVNGWVKMSEKRYNSLHEKLTNVDAYSIDKRGNIQNLVKLVKI